MQCNSMPNLKYAAINFQMAYPPVHQRPAWTQPLTVISEPVPTQVVFQDGLPQLRQVVATTTQTWDRQPRPPIATIRSRPFSAGAVRNNRIQTQQSQSARGCYTVRFVYCRTTYSFHHFLLYLLRI